MSLLTDVKRILRVSSDELDPEVALLIDAAKDDMVRSGLSRDYVDMEGPLVVHAISLFAKSHFGYDNPEAERFGESYRMAVCDLVNSSYLGGGL